MSKEIILASGSFLRKFIIEQSKLPYQIQSADIDELVFDHLPVNERVKKLAEKKCQKVAAASPDSIIIAADTLTTDENEKVYTKAIGMDDPFKAAYALSGKTIKVFTGCSFYEKSVGQVNVLITAVIKYQTFSEENLRRLASDDNPAIRSGALGIFYDAPGFTLIDHISGSYTGAFGLPMEFVYKQLEEIGYFKPTS